MAWFKRKYGESVEIISECQLVKMDKHIFMLIYNAIE